MKISDEISLSARNLLRRKGRTALTLVGVVIGTCMVVLMISLGIAQTKTNEEMLQSWGDLTQVQIYGYGTMVGSDGKPLYLDDGPSPASSRSPMWRRPRPTRRRIIWRAPSRRAAMTATRWKFTI